MDDDGSSNWKVLINPASVFFCDTDATVGLGFPGRFVLTEGCMNVITPSKVRAEMSSRVGRQLLLVTFDFEFSGGSRG